MNKKLISFLSVALVASLLSIASIFGFAGSAKRAYAADAYTPTTPSLSVWAIRPTISLSWTEPYFGGQDAGNQLGYNIRLQFLDAQNNPVSPIQTYTIRNQDQSTAQNFNSRTWTYSDSNFPGQKVSVSIAACNRACTQADHFSPYSSNVTVEISDPSGNGPYMPIVPPTPSATETPSTVDNHDAAKPGHCAPNSIIASLINPVKFDDPDANDLNAATEVNGKLIVPAQEHEVVCLDDTPGMSFHSDGIWLPKEYAGHTLTAFIYTEPKFVGFGTVEENGHLSLRDIDKYNGVHAIALYNENSEIVAKETIIVGEKAIAKTAGINQLAFLLSAILVTVLVMFFSVMVPSKMRHRKTV